jgi:hypothetical protein
MTTTDHTDHEAVELELYMMTEWGAYSAYYLPAVRNLARHWRADRFNLDLGIKGMRHAVDAAAKQYNREHGTMTTAWHDLFPVSTRDRVAESLVRDVVAEFKEGRITAADWS